MAQDIDSNEVFAITYSSKRGTTKSLFRDELRRAFADKLIGNTIRYKTMVTTFVWCSMLNGNLMQCH